MFYFKGRGYIISELYKVCRQVMMVCNISEQLMIHFYLYYKVDNEVGSLFTDV